MSLTPITRTFSANVGDYSVGNAGPDAIENDLNSIITQINSIVNGGVESTNIADNSITDSKIGNRALNDTRPVLSNNDSLTNLLSNLATQIKNITGKSAWTTFPLDTIESIKTILNSNVINTTNNSNAISSLQTSLSTLTNNILQKDNTTPYSPTAPTHPTTKGYVDTEINNRIVIIGAADMQKAVYDPNGVNSNVFDMENMVEGATKKILTPAERSKVAIINTTGDGNSYLANNGTYKVIQDPTILKYPAYENLVAGDVVITIKDSSVYKVKKAADYDNGLSANAVFKRYKFNNKKQSFQSVGTATEVGGSFITNDEKYGVSFIKGNSSPYELLMRVIDTKTEQIIALYSVTSGLSSGTYDSRVFDLGMNDKGEYIWLISYSMSSQDNLVLLTFNGTTLVASATKNLGVALGNSTFANVDFQNNIIVTASVSTNTFTIRTWRYDINAKTISSSPLNNFAYTDSSADAKWFYLIVNEGITRLASIPRGTLVNARIMSIDSNGIITNRVGPQAVIWTDFSGNPQYGAQTNSPFILASASSGSNRYLLTIQKGSTITSDFQYTTYATSYSGILFYDNEIVVMKNGTSMVVCVINQTTGLAGQPILTPDFSVMFIEYSLINDTCFGFGKNTRVSNGSLQITYANPCYQNNVLGRVTSNANTGQEAEIEVFNFSKLTNYTSLIPFRKYYLDKNGVTENRTNVKLGKSISENKIIIDGVE